MRPTERNGIKGLGLVEALVATTLAVALIGGLLAVVGNTAAATTRLAQQRKAQALARTLLSNPDPTTRSGDHDGLIWERRVDRSPLDPNSTTQDGFRIYRVTVSISGSGLSGVVRIANERLMR